jgi:hypothetical protein
MGEIMDDSNAARGMALYGVIGGMGRFVAPLVGSVAALPAKQFAKFGVPLKEFPFALPSAMVAFSCAGVLLFAYFELQETLKNRQKLDPTDKIKKNELYRQKKKTLRRGTAEYSAISGTDLDLDSESESPREKEREREDGLFEGVGTGSGSGPRPLSLRYGVGGGSIFSSTVNSNTPYRAISSSSSSSSSAPRSNDNRVMKPVTAMKKSLCLPLPLPLPLTSRHPPGITDTPSDDLLHMPAPTSARIEESLPSHFRMQSTQSSASNSTSTDNPAGRAGILGSDSVGGDVRVGDIGDDNLFALSTYGNGNGSRDLDLGNRLGILDAQRDGDRDTERGLGTGLGLEFGIGLGLGLVEGRRDRNGCLGDIGGEGGLIEVGRSSEGLGMINRNIDGKASEKQRRSEWGTAKPLGCRLESQDDIDFLFQSDSRRVSFSSLVMVKVIGSSSLGIGQLKHLRADDHPVEQADRRESGVGQGPGSVPQAPSLDTADTSASSRCVLYAPSVSVWHRYTT